MTAREGDLGTWSHCGRRTDHAPHMHTFAMNEGPYTVQCNGYDAAFERWKEDEAARRAEQAAEQQLTEDEKRTLLEAPPMERVHMKIPKHRITIIVQNPQGFA